MKNFKLLGLLFLGVLFALSSCNQEALNPLADDESALIDLMFLATTEDSTITGRSCNLTEVTVEELPGIITDYITANYAGATIERAGTSTEREIYVVNILKEDATYAGLIFDLEGNFISEKSRRNKGTTVAVEDLPSAISEYLTANYEGSEIHRSLLNDDGTYGILLILSDESYQGVGFDAEGVFVAEFSMKHRNGKKHGSKNRR